MIILAIGVFLFALGIGLIIDGGPRMGGWFGALSGAIAGAAVLLGILSISGMLGQ